MSALDYDNLPSVARDIADLIGLPATCALIEAYGGTRLYVPEHVPDGHPIARAIGAEAAQQLASVHGRDQIDMPRAHNAMRAALRTEIVARYIRGDSASTLAREYGCTERWVYALAARRREELASRQESLF